MQEKRLHLVNTARGNKDEIENGKKPELKGEGAISNFPKGEAAEKRGENVKNDLVPHVVL
jgi:hypothetical protein